jgi:hypothetical protein
MRDFAVFPRRTPEETKDPLNPDELHSGRLIVGTGYRGQYFVVEEIGQLMRLIAGPFSTYQFAAEAVILLRERALRNVS